MPYLGDCPLSFYYIMDSKKIIENAVSDAITEKPIRFKVKKKVFSIKPPTLGKMQVMSKFYLELDLNDEELGKSPHTESMRVCENKTDVVCKLMAASTFDKREDLLNDEKIDSLADFFMWNCRPSDFSLVVLAILTQVRYENFINSIRLAATLRQNKPK